MTALLSMLVMLLVWTCYAFADVVVRK